MSGWYLPHLYGPDEPDLEPIEYADVRQYDVGVGVDDGTATFCDAFGNATHLATGVWLVIVRGTSHTQVGAAFGETGNDAMDAALWMSSDHETTMLTADLIRPLGTLPAIDDLLASALCGTLAADVANITR